MRASCFCFYSTRISTVVSDTIITRFQQPLVLKLSGVCPTLPFPVLRMQTQPLSLTILSVQGGGKERSRSSDVPAVETPAPVRLICGTLLLLRLCAVGRSVGRLQGRLTFFVVVLVRDIYQFVPKYK